MYWAVLHNNFDLTKRLLTAKCDVMVDVKDEAANATRMQQARRDMVFQANYEGQTPFKMAVRTSNMKMLQELFAEFKVESLSMRDCKGENVLFECARNSAEEIYNWFMGSNEFFKARGSQNYEGRTIEHVVCMERQIKIVDEINPRPDTPDYYGSLPLYYALQQDDLPMLEKQFKEGRKYFALRNYKHETIFHVAAKNNARDSLKFLVSRSVFIQELLRKDYKGDTAIHAAAKAGAVETLVFLCQHATPGFLEM